MHLGLSPPEEPKPPPAVHGVVGVPVDEEGREIEAGGPRSHQPIFAPQRRWEIVGQVPNVVFVEGLVREGPRWLFYYGGADTSVGVAEALPVRLAQAAIA